MAWPRGGFLCDEAGALVRVQIACYSRFLIQDFDEIERVLQSLASPPSEARGSARLHEQEAAFGLGVKHDVRLMQVACQYHINAALGKQPQRALDSADRIFMLKARRLNQRVMPREYLQSARRQFAHLRSNGLKIT